MIAKTPTFQRRLCHQESFFVMAAKLWLPNMHMRCTDLTTAQQCKPQNSTSHSGSVILITGTHHPATQWHKTPLISSPNAGFGAFSVIKKFPWQSQLCCHNLVKIQKSRQHTRRPTTSMAHQSSVSPFVHHTLCLLSLPFRSTNAKKKKALVIYHEVFALIQLTSPESFSPNTLF